MRLIPSIPLLLVGALLAAGCTLAPPGGQGGFAAEPWRDELLQVQQDQSRLARQLEQLQDSQLLLEARLQDQQQLLQQLRQEVVAQRGTRPRERAESPGPGAASPAATAPLQPERTPSEIYLQAFSDYASGRFGAAIEGFQNFLGRYPANEFAANARYWLGECYYAQQDYGRAAAAFQQMVETHPRNDKAPEALWKRALALEQVGREEAAAAAIDLLLERYGQSPAAAKAREHRP